MTVESKTSDFGLAIADCGLRASNPQSEFRNPQLLRRGMTLIELLVVIVILTTIVGAAIPLMSHSNDDRRLREAARGLNTYIIGAQTRAISTKRPYGVAFKRLSQDTKRAEDNGVSLEAFYVEQQAPYTGFDSNSRACVALHPNRAGLVLIRFVTRGTGFPRVQDLLPEGWDADLFPPGTVRPHDVVEINGTRFELLPDNLSNDLANFKFDSITNSYYESRAPGSKSPVQIVAKPINDSGQQINSRYDDAGFLVGADREQPSAALPVPPKPPAPYWTYPSPYKVIRQPTPASDEPYQLPEGTAIDLRASGVGIGDYFQVAGIHDNSEGIIIMFAPEGRVARVSFSELPVDGVETSEVFDQSVVDNIYLLIGRRENIAPPDAKTEDKTLQSSITSVTVEEDREKLRQKLNWLGGSSRWIVIGSQTGRIATIENAFVDMAALYTKYTSSPYSLPPSSEQLRNQQILAAREFTHEMAQVGGR